MSSALAEPAALIIPQGFLLHTMGIGGETGQHIEDIFNFREGCHPAGGPEQGWQTSGSSCLTRLAFNLWNGWNADGCATPYDLFTTSGCNLHVGSGSASVPGVLQGAPGPQYESGQIRWDGAERKNSEIKANARKDLKA